MTESGEHGLETSAGNPTYGAGAASFAQPKERWHAKADAMASGWGAQFGEVLTPPGAALCLAVAQHETLCGDAWPGEHNWGAVQYRGLRVPEQTALSDAGLSPAPGNVTLARAALAAAVLAAKLVGDPAGALHVDSSPRLVTPSNPRGWYWVLFRAFPDDARGAAFFAGVLAGSARPGCRRVVDRAWYGGWDAQARDLAAEMYRTGYYEGFHDPRQPGGADANIADYAGAVQKLAESIAPDLADWVAPGAAADASAQAQGAIAQAANEIPMVDRDPPEQG